MHIEQIYTGCLAQGAYYITSDGEAAIIDPLREIQPYIDRLERDNVKLKYIFETHFHADFVSGHLDLSKQTAAPIVYGPLANCEFDCISAIDNQEFKVGSITIKAIHTPGHTLESTCYLLLTEDGKAHTLFSGDTLFIGDVGRPDLAQKAANLTMEELAAQLYQSLRNKIMTLPDDVIVYPAHGAGSACGKKMSKENISNIGQQKQLNYALRENMTQEEFVKEVTEGLLPPPAYFGMNVAMNKNGYESFTQVLSKGLTPLSIQEFINAVEKTGALVLDTRNFDDFHQGFIPQSVNIGIDGDFAPWVGALIADVKQSIVIVSALGREEEAVTRLSRVGFDHVLGFLTGGFDTWKLHGKEVDAIKQIDSNSFANLLRQQADLNIVDVRKKDEYDTQHLKNAVNLPLADINLWINKVNTEDHFYLHCAGGYRSMMASSILQARGYRNFTEVKGGFNALKSLI